MKLVDLSKQPPVRERVCASLRWCGLENDAEKNLALIDIEGQLSTGGSALQAKVVINRRRPTDRSRMLPGIVMA
jgi:acetate kinase